MPSSHVDHNYNDLFLEFDYGLASGTKFQYHHRLVEFWKFMGLSGDEVQQGIAFLEQVRNKESISEKDMRLW